MTELTRTTHLKEIERIVEHLFEYWVTKQFNKIEQFVHNHAVMIEPGTQNRLTGTNALIENYRDFIEEAEVFDYSIPSLQVDIIDDTGIAYLSYRLKYQVESTRYDEMNDEILVFRQQNRNWKIIWRTQLLGP